MEEVQVKIDENGEGAFLIFEENEELGQLIVSIAGNEITAHHTEVFPGGEGKGLGKLLLAELAAYARKNGLKIQALCPFVHGQFKRHPNEYSDIWQVE